MVGKDIKGSGCYWCYKLGDTKTISYYSEYYNRLIPIKLCSACAAKYEREKREIAEAKKRRGLA